MARPPVLQQADVEAAYAAAPAAVEKLKAEDASTKREGILELAKKAQEVAASRALESDVWCYRGAIYSLGIVLTFSVMGGVAIGILGNEVPQLLVAVGSGSVGALAGLVGPNIGGGGSK